MSTVSRLKQALVGTGARRELARSLVDRIDSARLHLGHQALVPPRSLRQHVTRLSDFYHTVDEYLAYFKVLGGLEMDDTILDIGCASGRFAVRLLELPHYFHGEYYGFDPYAKSIEWAQQHVQAQYPNLHFEAIDLYNGHYNPDGQVNPDNFCFPYDDNSFDFVFAWSVFTHMFPSAVANYLGEIQRLLKPGKRAIVTALLLDGYPETPNRELARARGLVRHSPNSLTSHWHHHGDHSFIHEDQPEVMMALQQSWMEQAIENEHLVMESMHYGSWNRADHYLSEQDLLVLYKPSLDS